MRPNQPATATINMRCRVSALTCALRVSGILTEHDSEHGKIRLAKPAPNYMGTPTWGHPHGDVQAPAMAPTLGQHTDEVLDEFSFGKAEIEKLRASGALG